MIFEQFRAPAGHPATPHRARCRRPDGLLRHSLWPFYSWFFHTLGVKVEVSTKISPRGSRAGEQLLLPAEIAHGAIQDVLDKGVDFLFLPTSATCRRWRTCPPASAR